MLGSARTLTLSVQVPGVAAAALPANMPIRVTAANATTAPTTAAVRPGRAIIVILFSSGVFTPPNERPRYRFATWRDTTGYGDDVGAT
ncbi:MAG: hypothetical protein L0I24_25760 [Pseudonocardia sp.]|nr:hypothetical protein [Pseudonocardia sp.]